MDNKSKIKHVWFDLEGTLTVRSDKFNKAHNELRYSTYANATGKTLNEETKKEYEMLYQQHGSNSATFRSLGFPSDFWQKHFNTLDKTKYYKPVEKIYGTLEKLKEIVPISIFTNLTEDGIKKTLKIIRVERKWFTHVLSGDDIKERKPALDGFYMMINKSKLKPEKLAYVGDRVDVDVKPANEVGMKSILVWSSSNEADYSFVNFEQILTIFQ